MSLSLLVAVFLISAPAAQAGAVDRDSCQQNCRIEQIEGVWTSVCACRGAGGVDKLWAGNAGIKAERRAELLLRKGMPSVSEEEFEKVRSNGCASFVSRARKDARPASELKFLLALAERPLCQCVAARTHFPVRKYCGTRGSGELACRFRDEAAKAASAGPVRDATLEDYQACLVRKRNYASPETCKEARCESKVPASCPAGEEVVNVADSGACCPLFVCQKVAEVW